jgi:hypothetical protein
LPERAAGEEFSIPIRLVSCDASSNQGLGSVAESVDVQQRDHWIIISAIYSDTLGRCQWDMD